jgi:hypothetical protein
MEAQGIHNALRICDWFQEVYCYLVDLHNRTNSGREIHHLIRNAPESEGGLRFACEWLFDVEAWNKLPTELAADFISTQARVKKS